MKKYQIRNLQKELEKEQRIVKEIKETIENTTETWRKNQLIREHNKHVRITKTIRENILDGLAAGTESM